VDLDTLYFFTATISQWRNLLGPDKYKKIILDSLAYLVLQRKIKVYAFVIMPNHVHFIWELLELNGKELPHASFMKYTSHVIQKDLIEKNHPKILELYKVDSGIRKYQFWQCKSLAVHLYTPAIIYQKLDYIHNNPCRGKWMLASSPLDYKYSSARFYETGRDDFGFLLHIGERL